MRRQKIIEETPLRQAARVCAKDFLRLYVERGDSIESICEGHMGQASREYWAQIGGIATVDGVIRRLRPQQLAVTRIADAPCFELFRVEGLVQSLIQEMQEARAGIGQESLHVSAKEDARCCVCQQRVEQRPGGHRRRQYCSATCKQAAYRARTQQQRRDKDLAYLRQRWANLSNEALDFLIATMHQYGFHLTEQIALILQQEQSPTLAQGFLVEHSRELHQELAVQKARNAELSDRSRLERQLLDLGEQIGYRRLLSDSRHLAIGAGQECYRAFAEGASDNDLAQANDGLRQFAGNLVWVDAQYELQQAKRRIAELEHELKGVQMQAVS